MVLSASVAAKRALEAVVSVAGHVVTMRPAEAEFAVIDQLHPVNASVPACPSVMLAPQVGGEDVLGCPVHPRALAAWLQRRVRSLPVTLAHNLTLDPLSRVIRSREAVLLTLTEKECELLKILAQVRPERVSRPALLAEVWGMDEEIDTHTLETHIYRLRSKLETLPDRPLDIATQSGAYILTLRE